MSMSNLIEYSNNYSDTSENSQQFYRDEPVLTDTGAFDNFRGNSASFKRKTTGNNGTKVVKGYH